jgi:hypothetical protein
MRNLYQYKNAGSRCFTIRPAVVRLGEPGFRRAEHGGCGSLPGEHLAGWLIGVARASPSTFADPGDAFAFVGLLTVGERCEAGIRRRRSAFER